MGCHQVMGKLRMEQGRGKGSRKLGVLLGDRDLTSSPVPAGVYHRLWQVVDGH